MLPSTGYFKYIACPFYEDGSCDRPYCHFKHARRVPLTEDVATNLLASTSTISEPNPIPSKNVTNVAIVPPEATNTLSQLVTEAVKKALAEQQVTDQVEISQNIASKVVEELKPTLAGTLQSSSLPLETPSITPTLPIANSLPCTYNPTPISELKKRHISIPIYNPVRESRVTAKRKASPDDRSRSWHSILFKNDDSDDSTYKPTPVSSSNDSIPGYVPTAKTTSTVVSYESSVREPYVPKAKEQYYVKVKKRREEYVPKKVKTPLNTNNVQLNDFNLMDEVLCMNSVNQNADSENFTDIGAKFSDDDLDYEDNNFLECVQKAEEKVGEDKIEKEEEDKEKEEIKGSINVQEKGTQEKENRDTKQGVNEDSKGSKNFDRSRKHSNSERKTDEQVNGNSSSHKSKEKSSEKDSKNVSKQKHSSSKHEDKKHSSKSSSRSSSKHSSSSKASSKIKDSKDNDSKKDRSKHDSHKSKKSKSDKESSDRHKKRSSSSSSKDEKSKEGKKSSESSRHSEKTSKSSKKDGESSKQTKEKSSNIDERLLLFEKDLFEDSDVDIEEECYKIFQEYEESDQPKPAKVCPMKRELEESDEEIYRKRIAHPLAESSVVRKPGPSQPIKKQPLPQQKLYERWRLMKEVAKEKAAAKLKSEATNVSSINKPTNNFRLNPKSTSLTHSNETHTFNGNGKVRIAHVPYAMSLAMTKKPVIEKPKEVEIRTAAQSNKSKSRVAHIPQNVPQLLRPEPLEPATHKFSLNIRQSYVNMMHDICLQIYNNGEDAVQRALSEEFACYERCRALNVYRNSCMVAVHRLKKELEQEKSEISVPSGSGMMSHEAVLVGRSKGSWSIMRPKKIITNFKGSALYNMLTKWILTEEQLRSNGYPRPHPDNQKGHAKVYTVDTRNHSILSKIPNERTCARCGETYMVDKKGCALRQQNCIYHWGRKYTIRGEGRYSCCQQYGSASGCSDAKSHVWDYVDYENLRGYVKTLPRDRPDDEQGVFSLDCEMCYTTQGLELTRVTVINEDCQVVYETLVKPENPIIDYNTRFSGITEEAIKDVTTTILDVQATLLTMFSSKTILVGHSLESDFKALKLIHDTVVDTSIMFPHKNGYPHKRALKNLCSEYLRKIIQNDIGGHDSNEDAVACMELILWKVKEEAKLQ